LSKWVGILKGLFYHKKYHILLLLKVGKEVVRYKFFFFKDRQMSIFRSKINDLKHVNYFSKKKQNFGKFSLKTHQKGKLLTSLTTQIGTSVL